MPNNFSDNYRQPHQAKTLSQTKRCLTLITTTLALLGLTQTSLADKTLQSSAVQANVLEVYTSQGCSSCPPAEAWLGHFKDDPDLWTKIIPMNFHVDYWDYLGWKDPYASAQFSQRQRQYNHAGKSRIVATPGFMLNGKSWNGWFRKHNVPLDNTASKQQLTVSLDAKTAKFSLQLPENLKLDSNKLRAHIAILGFDQVTTIKAGENRNKNLPHDFVVMGYDIKRMKNNSGSALAELTIPKSKHHSRRKAIVAWVSTGKDPSPIQIVADWL